MRSHAAVLVTLALLFVGIALPVHAQEPPDVSGIQVPEGYDVDVVAASLDYPTDIAFGANGEMYVAEAGGHTYGTSPEQAPQARILEVMPDGTTRVVYETVVPLEVLRQTPFGAPVPAEGIVPPLVGITYNERDGLLYVASRQRYATLNPNTGEWTTILDGLPSWGEFLNSKPIFDQEGKMWFVLSSQGNSGTVEAHWIRLVDIFDKPEAQEVPCEDVEVTGADYWIKDKLERYFPGQDSIRAEVYAPLGVNTEPGEVIDGQFWCNGAVYRVNPDGSEPERVAWGLRSIFGLGFSPDGRLVVTQNSGNIMTPRPIYDDWETVLAIEEGAWYGWPDYYSGLPITDARFQRPNDPEWTGTPEQHQFALTEDTRAVLLANEPLPPQPLVRIQPHAAAEGFVFGREEWGMDPESEILLAEFGSIIPYYKDEPAWPGFRVSHVNLVTGETTPFLINACGKPAWVEGCDGLRRPIMLEWGPDNALYLVDFGEIRFDEQGMNAQPDTGVIWKITRTAEEQ